MSTDSHGGEPIPVHDDTHGVFTDLFTAVKKKPQWVLNDLVPVGMTVMAAPPKSYKSTLEMAMALIAAGQPCGVLPSTFFAPTTGKVLGFSYEAQAGELRQMCEDEMDVKGVADESILIADDPWLFRLDDPDGISKLIRWCDELHPKLVFLDPLRDFHALDENDSGAIIRALRPLQRWAKEHEAAALVVHHTKKREEGFNTYNDLRGTSALFGMVDACLILTKVGQEMVRVKATFKRAKEWERTLTLAVYERKGMKPDEEIGEIERQVLKLLRAPGEKTLASIAVQLKAQKARVVEACATLERVGMVKKDGKPWRVIKKKA